MSFTNEYKNEMLALIVAAIESLNHPCGSRVREMMAEISNVSPKNSEFLNRQCDLFRGAFVYGVHLGLLLPDRELRRYKVDKSRLTSASYLNSLINASTNGDADKLPGGTAPVQPKNHINVDRKFFQWSDSSEDDNDIM